MTLDDSDLPPSYRQAIIYAQELRELYHKESSLRHELERRVRQLEELKTALQRQVFDLLALHEIGLAINSARNAQEMFDHIAQSLVGVTHANVCILFLWDEEAGRFFAQVGFGVFREKPADVELRESGLSRRVINMQDPLEVEDAQNSHVDIDLTPALNRGLRSFMAVPMRSRGWPVGVLYVGFREPHRFDERERQLSRLVADISAAALHRLQLLGELQSKPAPAPETSQT